MTKMTKKEKYEMIIAEFTKAELTNDTAMLVDFCKTEIEALDRKAAKAKERAVAKENEPDPIYDAVMNVLEATEVGTYVTIPTILEEINDENLTPGKITSRLTTMAKNGIVDKKTVTTSDKRKINGYALIRA